MTDSLTTDERNGAERCWIWRDSMHYPRVSFAKPEKIHPSVEYVRVLSPTEFDKRAHTMEGVDTAQYLTRLHDKVEAQRREITRLLAREKLLLDAHTGCGCEPTCAICREKGFT